MAMNKLQRLLAAGLFSLVAPFTYGYEYMITQDGISLKQELIDGKKEIRYVIQAGLQPEIAEAFGRSAQRWSDALDGKITFRRTDFDASSNDLQIVSDNMTDTNDIAETISLATDYYIYSSIIALNKKALPYENNKFSNVLITQKSQTLDDVLTHEIGHVLGLGDLHNDKNIVTPHDNTYDFPTMVNDITYNYPIMAGWRNPITGIRQTLHLDDIDGVRNLYGLPEWQDRSLNGMVAERIGWRKYRLYYSGEADKNLLWKFKDGGCDTGLQIEKRFRAKDVNKVKVNGKTKKYFYVGAEWNGKIQELNIPLKKEK